MSKLNDSITLILLFMCTFEEAVSRKCNSLEIQLPQGKIKGSYDMYKCQRKFLGIPYASLRGRFEAPGEPPSWNGTLKADRGQIKCKQYQEQWQIAVGQEDCLVLNVFTPTHPDKNPFPVMVFIHGGGFYWGSNEEWVYNPHYLVKENVIVVTINYRLGAFGFLCLGHEEAPGNAGLKDQIAALKWIQKNIVYFGGDPESITAFGESAGGSSVNYLIFSQAAEGLFHRAIIQSGTLLSPLAFSHNPIERASKVAQRLGHNTSDANELLKIFKNTPANDIIEASHVDPTNNAFGPYIFTPCLDTATTRGKPIITEQPIDLLRKNSLDISVIIGFNDKEGINWATHYYPITLNNTKEKLKDLVPINLSLDDNQKKRLVEDIILLYLTNGSDTENLIDYFTESLIRYPLTIVSEAFCEKPNRSVYNYYFKYDSVRNINKRMSRLAKVPGADHGDELFYLFDPVLYNLLPPKSKDRELIKNMVNLWTSFAKTGKPSNTNTTWCPCDGKLNFIELNMTMNNMTILPNNDRIAFWKEMYNEYGRK